MDIGGAKALMRGAVPWLEIGGCFNELVGRFCGAVHFDLLFGVRMGLLGFYDDELTAMV